MCLYRSISVVTLAMLQRLINAVYKQQRYNNQPILLLCSLSTPTTVTTTEFYPEPQPTRFHPSSFRNFYCRPQHELRRYNGPRTEEREKTQNEGLLNNISKTIQLKS